eukprot:1230872-Pyramimonas_sp.AAC.1
MRASCAQCLATYRCVAAPSGLDAPKWTTPTPRQTHSKHTANPVPEAALPWWPRHPPQNGSPSVGTNSAATWARQSTRRPVTEPNGNGER